MSKTQKKDQPVLLENEFCGVCKPPAMYFKARDERTGRIMIVLHKKEAKTISRDPYEDRATFSFAVETLFELLVKNFDKNNVYLTIGRSHVVCIKVVEYNFRNFFQADKTKAVIEEWRELDEIQKILKQWEERGLEISLGQANKSSFCSEYNLIDYDKWDTVYFERHASLCKNNFLSEQSPFVVYSVANDLLWATQIFYQGTEIQQPTNLMEFIKQQSLEMRIERLLKMDTSVDLLTNQEFMISNLKYLPPIVKQPILKSSALVTYIYYKLCETLNFEEMQKLPSKEEFIGVQESKWCSDEKHLAISRKVQKFIDEIMSRRGNYEQLEIEILEQWKMQFEKYFSPIQYKNFQLIEKTEDRQRIYLKIKHLLPEMQLIEDTKLTGTLSFQKEQQRIDGGILMGFSNLSINVGVNSDGMEEEKDLSVQNVEKNQQLQVLESQGDKIIKSSELEVFQKVDTAIKNVGNPQLVQNNQLESEIVQSASVSYAQKNLTNIVTTEQNFNVQNQKMDEELSQEAKEQTLKILPPPKNQKTDSIMEFEKEEEQVEQQQKQVQDQKQNPQSQQQQANEVSNEKMVNQISQKEGLPSKENLNQGDSSQQLLQHDEDQEESKNQGKKYGSIESYQDISSGQTEFKTVSQTDIQNLKVSQVQLPQVKKYVEKLTQIEENQISEADKSDKPNNLALQLYITNQFTHFNAQYKSYCIKQGLNEKDYSVKIQQIADEEKMFYKNNLAFNIFCYPMLKQITENSLQTLENSIVQYIRQKQNDEILQTLHSWQQNNADTYYVFLKNCPKQSYKSNSDDLKHRFFAYVKAIQLTKSSSFYNSSRVIKYQNGNLPTRTAQSFEDEYLAEFIPNFLDQLDKTNKGNNLEDIKENLKDLLKKLKPQPPAAKQNNSKINSNS